MCLTNCVQSNKPVIVQDPLDTDCFKVEFEDDCDYIDIEDTDEVSCSVNNLAIMQLNCRGLIGKQTDLSQFLHKTLGERKVDIVILVETWLTSESEKN